MTGRVMLIDDEPATLHALVYVLRQEGLDAHGFPNASQAMSAIRDSQWDVVVCDYHLPDGTGIDVCEQIQLYSPSTFRILLSGKVNKSTLEDAVRQGTIHTFVAKPWNNAFLKRSVQEGCRQSQLLSTIHRLKNVVRNEHPALITDSNWIIRLANHRFCEFLGVEENQIFGLNLFAPTLSGAPLTQESEITRLVEADNTWLGDFTFFDKDRNPVTTRMAVSTINVEHRICCCLPRENEGINRPAIPQEAGTEAINGRAGFSEELSNKEALSTQLVARGYSGKDILLLSFSPTEISDSSASRACIARIRQAMDRRVTIRPLEPHILAVFANDAGIQIDWATQESAILSALQTPLSLYNQTRTVDPDCLRITVPHAVSDLTDILSGCASTEAITSIASAPAATTESSPEPTDNPLSEHEDSALPIFNQQNTLAALEVPNLILTSPERWRRWYITMITSWRQHHQTPFQVLIDSQALDEQLLNRLLNTLDPSVRKSIWLVLRPQDLNYFRTLGCNIMLKVNPDQEQEPGTWTLAELQSWFKDHSGDIQGLCLPPRQFSYLKNDTRKGCEMLKKLQESGLTIWACHTDSTEALAASHLCGVDWLSGSALSMPLSANQLNWFAN